MNLIFEQQLNRELLLSERKRVLILIGIFCSAMVFRVINLHVFKGTEPELVRQDFSTLWVFPAAIILFEVFSLLYINARIKTKNSRIPLMMQYLNAGAEICLPTFIIMIVASQRLTINVLHSPAMLTYFLFIILSTLRLNFCISVFYGLLSALSYAMISIFKYDHFNSNDVGWSFILLLSGIASGLVAGQIRSGINISLREAQKRHKVENLFAQQISPEVAEKILENNGVMECRRMLVTVMFIDIRDFTAFASCRSPEEIVHYQNTFFQIVIDAVTKFDGIVNQILGDGCMVTFGAPLPLINQAGKAVGCALKILEELEIATRSGRIYHTKIGIGIHTGEAVTGNIGTETRRQYSITGNVVIMASRIEQLNKTFHSQLLVSQEVINAMPPLNLNTQCYQGIGIKGFDKPVSVYKVA